METRRFKVLVPSFFMLLFTRSLCFTCGPNSTCVCESKIQMDCSRTFIPIKNICDFIYNSTDHKILSLHIERNSYDRIEKLDFKGCNDLSRLYLGKNKINSIENDSFDNLYQLKLLDISHNMVNIYDPTVQRGVLFPLTLERLMLNGNLKNSSLVSYPNLSYLTNLSVLYMDGLQNNIFPDDYRTLDKLTTLVLSGINGNCNISHISDSTFRNTPFLRTLNISSCNIANIDAGAFQILPLLEILDLSENLRLGFRMLGNVSFGLQFTNIKSLNYSKVYSTFGMGTRLRKQDICYLYNTTLSELVLNGNRLQVVETNAAALVPDTLEVLRVEDNIFTFGPYLLQLGCINNLTDFHGSYQNTAHNLYLFEHEPVELYDETNETISDCPYMENSFLSSISSGRKKCYFIKNDNITFSKYPPTFPLKLRKVEMCRCNFEYDINPLLILPIVESIEYVDVSGNILYSWTGPVGPFPNLTHLNLSRNYCSNIGLNFFDGFESVEDLQLQENLLGLVLSNEEKGSVIFRNLTDVKVLNLSSNVISYMPPSVFSNISKLEILDLSVNNIDRWTVDVMHLNNLLHLNLKSNFLRILPRELRSKLEGNSKRIGTQFSIDLSNNTITTYCDEREFLKWVVEHRKNFVNFENYIFFNASGEKMSVGRFIAVVNGLDKACSSYTLTIVLCSIGLAVFLAITVGGFIYKNRWQLRYLLRISKLRHFGYKTLQDHYTWNENYIYDVFVSYANENIRFILDKMVPNLENKNLKICLHDRDFLPGKYIADNILDAIRNSKKTVIVLSTDFLKSKWCIYEFNMARMESLYSREGQSCLLVVLYEDVPARNMSTEMIEWIRSNTYIEYTVEPQGEELFWQNIEEALRE